MSNDRISYEDPLFEEAPRDVGILKAPGVKERRKTGPKHLNKKGLGPIKLDTRRGVEGPPVELTQEEWDAIHGDDPLSVFALRGQPRPVVRREVPDARTGEMIENPFKTPFGFVHTIYESDEDCPRCGAFRQIVKADQNICLGCKSMFRQHDDEVRRLRGQRAKSKGGKKSGEAKGQESKPSVQTGSKPVQTGSMTAEDLLGETVKGGAR